MAVIQSRTTSYKRGRLRRTLGSPRPLLRRSQTPRILLFATILAFFVVYTFFPNNALSGSSLEAPIFEGTQRIQYDFEGKGITAGDRRKANEVKSTMERTFWTYKNHAWGFDEVRPISGQGYNSMYGWGSTIIRTMTTIAVMKLEELLTTQIDYVVRQVDFTKALDIVDVTETTTQMLGALISTIDLLDSEMAKLKSPYDRDALLDQAVVLAKKLSPSYDSPVGIPWSKVDFAADRACHDTTCQRHESDIETLTIDLAQSGTNWLENTALSRLSKDPAYNLNATRSWSLTVWNRQQEKWPGLINSPLKFATGLSEGHSRTWGFGQNSYYEYLLKAYIMYPKGNTARRYRKRWIQAVETTMRHLASWSEPTKADKISNLYLGKYQNGVFINEMEHEMCSAAANFILGGKFLQRPDILKFGLELLNTCHHVYTSTATSVGPERWSWIPRDSAPNATHLPSTDGHKSQLKYHGYWITNARYSQQPDMVEAYFYAYRITGDKNYQRWAWSTYKSLMKSTQTAYGYAGLEDVTMAASADNMVDRSEPVWGAETLKYLYLTFAEDSLMNLDQWVFSAGGHPLRIISS